MSGARGRVAAFAALTLAVTCLTASYAWGTWTRSEARRTAEPTVAVAASVPASGPRLVFRHTGIDDHNGLVASVPLSDPSGPRSFTPVACDRVDATAVGASCLQTVRGVVTRYRLTELDASWGVTRTVSVPGIPSRTRLSDDGSLVGTTTFVSGHSYLQVGFSTVTQVRGTDGRSFGDLEKFTLVLDGVAVAPRDRNVWGVTFIDDTSFYATVATGGTTYLVRGDLDRRTLTSVRRNAECPSLSPDGTRVAYKVDSPASGTHWSFAVLDLRTGRQTPLDGETRNVDDQVEWLDDDTLLYAVPRSDEPVVSDVWSLDVAPDARPRLLVEQASSPSVVRP